MKIASSRKSTRLSASRIALLSCLAASCCWTSAAEAQTLDSTNSPLQIDSGTTSSVTVASGTNAVLMPSYAVPGVAGGWITVPSGSLLLDYNNSILTTAPASSSPFGGASEAAQINVAQGGTLTFAGVPTLGYGQWVAMNNMINAEGNVVIEDTGGNSINLAGTNNFLGNLTLQSGAQLNTGQSWGAAAKLSFGSASNVSLGSGASWYINQGTNSATIGGALSATDSTATVYLASGTLTVNGQNTSSNPFLGTLTIAPGSTFVVGDSTHSSAIFGDPSHTDGSTLSLAITRSSTGAVATLQGYGTIYGTVNNSSGIVQPGGTAGKLGTLTVSNYTQGSTGILKVEVSPTGASQLKVLGTAKLDGTLNIAIDSGKYGNAVYKIISADNISGTFSNVVTTGNTAGAIAGLQVTSTGYSVVTESTDSAQVISHIAAANRDNVKQFTGSLFDMIATTSPSYGARKVDYGHGISAWGSPFGQHSNVSNAGTAYNVTSGGILGGIEKSLPMNGKIGIAVGYSGGTLHTQEDATHAHINTLNVAAYGGIELQYARIDAVAFYNHYDATTSRSLDSYGTATGSLSGTAYGGSLQLSHGIFNNVVVPYLRGTYSYNLQNPVTESGAGPLALAFDGIRLHSFFADAGLRIHPVAPLGKICLRPELVLAVEHDFSNPGEHVTGQFATISGSPFLYSWAGNSNTAGLAALNLTAELGKQFELFAQFDGRFTSRQNAEGASIGLRARF